MEVIEKVKEIEKEPTKEYASKGVAGTGLGLGIAGTALGLLALNRGGFGLFGNGWGYNGGMPQNVNINADVNGTHGDFGLWMMIMNMKIKYRNFICNSYNIILHNTI